MAKKIRCIEPEGAAGKKLGIPGKQGGPEGRRRSLTEENSCKLRELAIDGDGWALEVFCRYAASEKGGPGPASTQEEINDFFGMWSVLSPRRVVEAYAERVGVGPQPEKESVIRAIGGLPDSIAETLRGELEKIAGLSPCGEIRKAARERIG